MFSAYVNLDQSLHSIGVVRDSDAMNARDAAREFIKSLKKEAKILELPPPNFSNTPGIIIEDSLRTGIHIFPDNNGMGTLDYVLSACAEVSYRPYKRRAEQYLDYIINDIDDIYTRKLKKSESEKQKALVSAIVSVLKPIRANTPSIADDKWICKETLASVPALALLHKFISDLLELPTPSAQSIPQVTP